MYALIPSSTLHFPEKFSLKFNFLTFLKKNTNKDSYYEGSRSFLQKQAEQSEGISPLVFRGHLYGWL
jgi:3-phenylpropionate/cinnamic acid dioxygenase small subunit